MTIKMPPRTEDRQAAPFIAGAPAPKADNGGKVVVNLRVQADLLDRIDADAQRLGISRTAWLHIAANRALGS
jgi:hypothetical protein